MAHEDAPRPSMATRRPPPAVNSGSKFMEGSMNDRISSAPPSMFLGPDQLANFERKFYGTSERESSLEEPRRETRSSSRRRERPLSAAAQLQNHPYSAAAGGRVESEERQQEQNKKSNGFFSRVRDALGFGRSAHNTTMTTTTSKVRQEMEKRSSLQQPMMSSRPSAGDARSRSEVHIPQMPASIQQRSSSVAAGERPSRDEMMESYHHLMATGFFQAHAIKSTRQPPPGSKVRQTKALPTIPSPRKMALDEPMREAPPVPWPLPQPALEYVPRSPSRAPPAPPGPSEIGKAVSCAEDSARHPATTEGGNPSLNTSARVVQSRASNESLRYALRGRGRKRAHIDAEDQGTEVTAATEQAEPSGAAKRVTKKLRKMPSSGAISLRDEDAAADHARRRRSPSSATTGLRSSSRGAPNRLRKRSKSPAARSRPPVTLDKYNLPVDSGRRTSVDMKDRDAAASKSNEGLRIAPDSNRGIPSVPSIPTHWKRGGGVWDENFGGAMQVDDHLQVGEALPGLN